MRLSEAIAHIEGFYSKYGADGKPLTSPNRPQRNNNPGNLEFHGWMQSYGATLETGVSKPRFAAFPSVANGFAALDALLAMHYASMTVQDAINKFAPPVENNTSKYVNEVCRLVGCSPTDLVKDVM